LAEICKRGGKATASSSKGCQVHAPGLLPVPLFNKLCYVPSALVGNSMFGQCNASDRRYP